ncbi:Uncharacterised protein [Clostridioides difficile]|nr:Uncharacterised protein [Clostridioides difficile]SJR46599.1 Uncharacterised protein [Clostridioides difficile]SJV64313.1 Uncharacterised protein [Clostridioides difficile]SJV78173.1 Uncharacterised protein [Clostridioides difficile]SUY17700.1 Uncharacterised protein [Clostridioides difficile]
MNFLVRETLSFIRNQIYFHNFNNEKEAYLSVLR